MNIQGFQKLTLLDFPGRVACTVFTGGCNLRCPFCHNASLVRTSTANPAMEAEVIAYLTARKGLLDGVCVTGGEPLLQPDLPVFLTSVKALGYAVKLDTNGSLPQRLRGILNAGLVDYLAMDVKSSPVGYASATGGCADTAPYKESMHLIRESGLPYEFRTTAVKGLHTADDFAAIATWLAPQDAYFIQQFVDSGELLGNGCQGFSKEEMATLLQVVQKHLPRAALRGVS